MRKPFYVGGIARLLSFVYTRVKLRVVQLIVHCYCIHYNYLWIRVLRVIFFFSAQKPVNIKRAYMKKTRPVFFTHLLRFPCFAMDRENQPNRCLCRTFNSNTLVVTLRPADIFTRQDLEDPRRNFLY